MARLKGFYPSAKVIWGYILLGGFLTNLFSQILIFCMQAIVILSPDYQKMLAMGMGENPLAFESLGERITDALFLTIPSITLTFIPFFITSYGFVIKKFAIGDYKDYFKVFGIGFMVGVLYILVASLVLLNSFILLYTVVSGLDIGICSLILSTFILPKTKKEFS